MRIVFNAKRFPTNNNPKTAILPPPSPVRSLPSCAKHLTPPSCADAHRPHTYGVRLAPRCSSTTILGMPVNAVITGDMRYKTILSN